MYSNLNKTFPHHCLPRKFQQAEGTKTYVSSSIYSPQMVIEKTVVTLLHNEQLYHFVYQPNRVQSCIFICILSQVHEAHEFTHKSSSQRDSKHYIMQKCPFPFSELTFPQCVVVFRCFLCRQRKNESKIIYTVCYR